MMSVGLIWGGANAYQLFDIYNILISFLRLAAEVLLNCKHESRLKFLSFIDAISLNSKMLKKNLLFDETLDFLGSFWTAVECCYCDKLKTCLPQG